MSTNFQDVGEFHKKFGLPYVDSKFTFGDIGPQAFEHLSVDELKELLKFRINFIIEELKELANAVGFKLDVWLAMPDDWTPEKIDHVEAFDALIDIAYVVFGMAHKLGYPWESGWDAVQAANMAKVRGKKDGSDSKRGSAWDVVKPEGWTAPDHRPILEAYGYPV